MTTRETTQLPAERVADIVALAAVRNPLLVPGPDARRAAVGLLTALPAVERDAWTLAVTADAGLRLERTRPAGEQYLDVDIAADGALVVKALRGQRLTRTETYATPEAAAADVVRATACTRTVTRRHTGRARRALRILHLAPAVA